MKCRFAAAFIVLALSACGGSSTPSVPNNPSSTLVTVMAAGAPLSGVTVTLSKAITNHTPAGVIATAVTNAAGQVTFALPALGTVCVSAVQPVTGGSTFSGECGSQPFPATATISF